MQGAAEGSFTMRYVSKRVADSAFISSIRSMSAERMPAKLLTSIGKNASRRCHRHLRAIAEPEPDDDQWRDRDLGKALQRERIWHQRGLDRAGIPPSASR